MARRHCPLGRLFGLATLAFAAATVPALAGEPDGGDGEGPSPGLVFTVGGVGGMDSVPLNLRLFLPLAGVRHEVRDFVWTHGFGRMIKDLQDTAHVEAKAQLLAELLAAEKKSRPHRPIFVVANSGGAGLTLSAAKRLPPDTLERLILLSAAVSPGYDLRPGLRATRREVVSFHSRGDRLILDLGTRQFGTIDRQYVPSAGLTGFEVPDDLSPADARLYKRLVQIPWEPRMLLQGHSGLHSGTAAPLFLIREVAPWLREDVVQKQTPGE